MVEQYSAGKKILLVIDEAQNLSRKVLEEVRLLSGLEAQKEKLLRIIIAGQPELSHKLDSPRLAQLMQRVRLRFHLGALAKHETHEYITHRLNVAGANGRTIFTPEACDVVFRYAGGVPRLVNVLCDTAMLCAFAEERTQIDADLIKAAVEELQWVEFTERLRAQDRNIERTGEFAGLATQPMARLEVLYRDQLVGEHRLGPGKTIIGRTPDNDVQIHSRFISRHHAQVVSDKTQSVVEDLNSTNGVFIRAQRVKQHVLADGDIIQIGEHKLLYRDMRGAKSLLIAADDDDELDDLDEDEDGEDEDERDDDVGDDSDAEELDQEVDERER
jgi:general secretion pathway protein A